MIFTGRSFDGIGILLCGVPCIAAIVGYVLMKWLLFDLMDEVYDQGDALLLRNKGKEIRIPLKEIKNVSCPS